MTLAVERDELTAVAPEIWNMMLGVDLAYTGEGTHEFGLDTRSITGLVTVVGVWTGAVTLQCATDAARRFAAAMFCADDPAALPLEEVRDAHAELVNMTGGNIKNLVSGTCTLGIPTITEGIGYEVRLPRTVPVRKLLYRTGDDVIGLVVYEPKR